MQEWIDAAKTLSPSIRYSPTPPQHTLTQELQEWIDEETALHLEPKKFDAKTTNLHQEGFWQLFYASDTGKKNLYPLTIKINETIAAKYAIPLQDYYTSSKP